MNVPTPTLNRRILVIDDNRAIHDDFRKILGELDPEEAALQEAEAKIFGVPAPMMFELDDAYQGEEGLEMVKRALAEGRPYAMAFVDVRMPPGWDGIETTQRLWEVCPDLQVVICTAFADCSWNEMREQINPLDRLLILKKPFDTIEVLQMANALTEKWRLVQESKARLGSLELRVKERTRELEASQAAALTMMEDAVHHREKAEQALVDLKKADEALKMQGRVLESMSEGVTVCNEAGRIIFSNSACNAMFGYTSGELMDQHFSVTRADPPEESRQAVDELFRQMREKEPWMGELSSRRKDGTTFITRSRISVLELGGAKSFVAVVEDITEKKSMEAQFLRSQRMESLGRLASGIAHDMNNILTPMLLSVFMLRRQLPPADFEKMLGIIESNSRRGADIIKQLLTFGRGAGGQRKVVQTNGLVMDIVSIMAGTFPKNIMLTCGTPDNIWPVLGDATQLNQVLLNLCVNARDAMPTGGRLSLLTKNVRLGENYAAMNIDAKAGPYVMLRVSDTGDGIPPEVIDKIFDPFFTTKDIGKGTGLGLSTVMGIVKGHEGFVNLRSQVGSGSTFEIYLPASPGAVEVISPPAAPAATRGNGQLILVVDDEDNIRDVVQKTLVGYGYRVVTASNGTEAVAAYSQHADEIKLVLTDVMMPMMDGVMLSRTLKKMNPGLKIIASSGMGSAKGMQNQNAELRSLDVKTFLNKPYTASEVLTAVSELLSPGMAVAAR